MANVQPSTTIASPLLGTNFTIWPESAKGLSYIGKGANRKYEATPYFIALLSGLPKVLSNFVNEPVNYSVTVFTSFPASVYEVGVRASTVITESTVVKISVGDKVVISTEKVLSNNLAPTASVSTITGKE